MLVLNPQSGNSSLCLGRLGLPDRLPFSKPKVNCAKNEHLFEKTAMVKFRIGHR